MLRLIFGISVLVTFTVYGGWPGLLTAMFTLGIIGVFLPRREKAVLPTELFPRVDWEKVDHARRGSEADPTRPQENPLLITNEIRRRR